MNEPLPIAAFHEIINSTLQEFLALSTEIGAPVEGAAYLAEQAFGRCADLVIFGLYNDAPPNKMEFFQRHPLNGAIQALGDYFEDHRQERYIEHVQCLSSSILALNWIAAEKNPCTVVKDMRESGQYFSDRVLRTKLPLHCNWVKKWNQVLVELENYVRSHFLTGFTWGALRANQANRGAAVPPPPPPPPPGDAPGGPAPHGDAPGGSRPHGGQGDSETIPFEAGQGDHMRQELLNELNQGTNITRRLRPTGRPGYRRHVPRPPAQAAAGPAQAAAGPAQAAAAGPAQAAAAAPAQAAAPAANRQGAIARPPKCELEGRKWVVEHQRNAEGIRIDNNSMSESLSMYQCENSSLEVADKINSVVIDNCHRTNVMLHGVVGSVSLVRCSRISIQFDGAVPLVNIDNSESIQIFVDRSSRGVVIISSQSQALNVCLLEDGGDYAELPIPEQIRTEIRDGRLHSTVYENCG